MTYLAIDLAIWERLVGAPLDPQGRPTRDSNGVPRNRLLPGFPYSQPDEEEEERGITGPVRRPSYGLRLPLPKKSREPDKRSLAGQRGAMNAFNPTRDLEPHTYKQVAVFPLNVEGVNIADIWPCVTFHFQDETFDAASGKALYWDPIEDEPSYNGVMATGMKTRRAQRVHPQPFSPTYCIRVYARHDSEFKLLCHQVKYMFPPRGVLEVEQADGSSLAYNMIMTGVLNLSTGGALVRPGIAGDEPRDFCMQYAYKIEAFEDNTINGLGKQDIWESSTIQNRYLSLEQIQTDTHVFPVTALSPKEV